MELKLKLSGHFGAKNTNNRQLLRESLLKDLKSDGFKVIDQEILNLAALPKCEDLGISISHTEDIGGYLIGNGVKAVGFDIESTDRISEKVAQRIAKSNENYPAPDFYWGAKEATYKLLSTLGKAPAVISEIEILKWEEDGCDAADFEFAGGQGRVWREKEYTLAVAWV